MTIGSILSLNWLTGPILAKELRQTSRRPWLMLVKTAYIVLLIVLIYIVCGEAKYYDASQQMSFYSQALTRVVVWFQFLSLQLIAMATMSTTISDEIRRRTFITLVSTPITPLQIVIGKLLSRLTAIAMLIGVSLPVLAIMRVFGGVPWEYLVRGLCITAATVLLTSAVSMFFSILAKRSYAVILLTIMTFFLFFLVIPTVTPLALHDTDWFSDSAGRYMYLWLLVLTNPYVALTAVTSESFASGTWNMLGGGQSMPWIEHCLAMLAFSLLILWRCVAMVRTRSRREGEGFSRPAVQAVPPPLPPAAMANHAAILGSLSNIHSAARPIVPDPTAPPPDASEGKTPRFRLVRGNPVAWKEVASPLFASRMSRWLVITIVAFVLLVIYWVAGESNSLSSRYFNITMLCLYFTLGLLTTGSVAAGSVCGEKESSTLDLLLTTQLSPWSIAWGKFLGSFRRSLIVWIAPVLHVLIMGISGWYGVSLLLMIPIIFCGLITLVGGIGVFSSATFKKTSSAVIFTIMAMLFLWLLLPLIVLWVSDFRSFGQTNILANLFFDSNPAVQITQAVEGTDDSRHGYWNSENHFDWSAGKMDATGSVFYILFFASFNILAGMLLLLRSAFILARRKY